MSEFDAVEKPQHYNSHPSGLQTIDCNDSLPFCTGNAIKYLWRTDLKNGVEDIKKARWYLRREVQRLANGVVVEHSRANAVNAAEVFKHEQPDSLLAHALMMLVMPGFYYRAHVEHVLFAVEGHLQKLGIDIDK
jgi:hypothetical protein